MDILKGISFFVSLLWGLSLVWIIVGTLIGLVLIIFYTLAEGLKIKSILKKLIIFSFAGWIVFIVSLIIIFLLRFFEGTTGIDLRYFPADL